MTTNFEAFAAAEAFLAEHFPGTGGDSAVSLTTYPCANYRASFYIHSPVEGLECVNLDTADEVMEHLDRLDATIFRGC